MNSAIKQTLRIAGGLVVVALLALFGLFLYVSLSWDAPYERPVVEMTAPTDAETIARGKYLYAYTHACWGCHSPEMNADVLPIGGREFDMRNIGPGFGVYYAPNITPDNETGIGTWTDGEIVRALREGIRKDGTVLFPLMPVEAFRGLSDEDALAITAYLKSLPPVRNEVPRHEPSFILKALFTFGVIRPEVAITEPVIAPPRGVTVAYGEYMANNGAGCMDCHTPRNLEDGSFYRDSLFAGSTVLFGQDEKGVDVFAYARNITFDRETGIGDWTEEQFLDAMRAGMRPDGTVLSTHMPYPYYGLMDEADLKAIYKYLKTVPTFRRTTPDPTTSRAYSEGGGVERGEVIFRNSCQMCHGAGGKGAPPTGAVLADVSASFDDQLLKDFIREGNIGLRMPAFGKTLTAEQIDDVVAYIRSVEKK